MDGVRTRLLDGAKLEIKAPQTISMEVSIYSVPTDLQMELALEILKEKGFTAGDRHGDFQPRILDVSADVSNALEMFAQFPRPELVSEATISVQAGSQRVVSVARSIPYAMQTTTETDLVDSTRVHVKNGEIRCGITLHLEPVINREGGVTLTCHREVSRPVETEQDSHEEQLLRVVKTFSSAKGFMKANDAFIHVEFVQPEKPKSGFSGEVIITVITAEVVS
jgi:hypothetical protein